MGYDITFHPISEEQMDAWYFSLMDSLAKGDTSRLEAVAEEAGMDPFYINKYRDLMKYAAGVFPQALLCAGDCHFFHGGGVPADGKVYHAMEGYSS